MSDENQTTQVNKENAQKDALKGKYRTKGFQSMTYAEYQALREKKAKKKKFAIPAHFKFILSTPLFIIVLFGLFFIPFMFYLIVTGPQVGIQDPEKDQAAATRPAR